MQAKERRNRDFQKLIPVTAGRNMFRTVNAPKIEMYILRKEVLILMGNTNFSKLRREVLEPDSLRHNVELYQEHLEY